MIAISIHQYGHIKTAILFKDYTYKRTAENSINPFMHIPLISMYTGLFLGIMWTKRIKFHSKAKSEIIKRNQELVFNIAGMITNLLFGVFMLASVELILFVAGSFMNPSVCSFFHNDIRYFGLVNIYIAILNLLPIRGFDSYMFIGLLQQKLNLAKNFKKAYDIVTCSMLSAFLLYGLQKYHLYMYDFFFHFQSAFSK